MELLYRFKFYVKLQVRTLALIYTVVLLIFFSPFPHPLSSQKFMYDFQQTQKPERKGRIEAMIDELAPDPPYTLSKLVDVDSEDDDKNDEKWYSHDIME